MEVPSHCQRQPFAESGSIFPRYGGSTPTMQQRASFLNDMANR